MLLPNILSYMSTNITMDKSIWIMTSNRWNSAICEYALNAGLALQRRGWNVLATGLKGKAFDDRAQLEGLPTAAFNSFGIAGTRSFVQTLKAATPNFILTTAGPETTLACSLSKKPKILRLRADDRDYNPHSKKRRFFFPHRIASYIVPAPSYKAKLDTDGRPVFDAMLGCDTKKFFHKPPASRERPIVTIFGRFDPVKGHGAFFLFYSQLLRYWPKALPRPLLKVVGEAANISRREMISLAGDVGLSPGDDMQLIDERIRDPAALLSETHVGVICSQGSEIICRVAEEFLLCGTPIFVSGVGALSDCLKQKDFGFKLPESRLQEKARTISGPADEKL